MSSRQRRLPEDSVLVSISQVQEMLRAEATPPRPEAPVRSQRPVPMPVPEEVIGGVPSMAEIEASRQERWREEAPLPRLVTAPSARRRRLVGIAIGLVVLLALGAGAWLGVRWWRDRGDGAGSVAADARFTAVQAMRLAAASTRAEAAERALAEAQAEAQQLRADKVRAEATAAEAAAQAAATPAESARVVKHGTARRTAARGATSAKAAPKGPPRPRRPMDKTDKHLSSLIESL